MRWKKIVITGGAGFLGSHLASSLLTLGGEVVILDDFSNGKEIHLQKIINHPQLTVQRGDITNSTDVQRAFADAEVILHLAVLDLRASIKDPLRVNRVIVDGTLTCLEQARKQPIQLFLNCSSSEVYGSAQKIPMDETHPLHPETPYAAAKVAQDMYVRTYGETYGLPWNTVRPFNMYGPHSHWQGARGELIPKMIVRAMNRQPLVIFGDGQQTRDFTYVQDACDAIIKILEQEKGRGEIVNICSGVETSVLQMARVICQYFKLDPELMIQRQAARPADVRRHLGDPAKLKTLFHFTPTLSLEQGLPKTIEWFTSLPDPARLLTQEVTRNWE